MLRAAAFIFFVVLTTPAVAHPWGGLVVNHRGDIYFTFVCPPISDNHVACVWLLQSGEEPRPVLTSDSDPSDIILTRDANRTVYAAERVGGQPYRTRLWRFSDEGEPSLILPFQTASEFSADAYAIATNGMVFFHHAGEVWARDRGGQPAALFDDTAVIRSLGRIANLEVLPNGELLVQSGSDLFAIDRQGTLRTLGTGLRLEDPPRLPFRGANILFDMTVSFAGHVLLAYYGNREVLRVDPDGETTTILHAEAPWSPSGVDECDGVVFVLESTTPAPAWQFWRRNEIRPRIRSIDAAGEVRVIWGL